MATPSAVKEPPAALADLQALVKVKERDAGAFQSPLAELWVKRQAGTLPREGYPEVMYLEDQLRVTLQQLEDLKPQLIYAQAEDAVRRGQAHHDLYCQPVAEAGMQLCQLWKQFIEACATFVDLVDEQVSPLMILPRADGQPAFELDDGAMTLQHMLVCFPGQPAQLVAGVIPFLRTPMTVGQSQVILAHVKGQTPFSETNVQRFLEGYKPDEPTDL